MFLTNCHVVKDQKCIWRTLERTRPRLKHGEREEGENLDIVIGGLFSLFVSGIETRSRHKRNPTGHFGYDSLPQAYHHKRKVLYEVFLSTVCAGRRTPSWLSSQSQDGQKDFSSIALNPLRFHFSFLARSSRAADYSSPLRFCKNNLIRGPIRLDPCTSDPTVAQSLCPGYFNH